MFLLQEILTLNTILHTVPVQLAWRIKVHLLYMSVLCVLKKVLFGYLE